MTVWDEEAERLHATWTLQCRKRGTRGADAAYPTPEVCAALSEAVARAADDEGITPSVYWKRWQS